MKRMKHPTHGFAHAHNTLEEEAMRKSGWVDDAPEPEPEPEPEVDAGPDRDAMLADAESRGMRVDKRWSTARLADELAKG